ncbi:YraN family protein [Cryptosporangium arvum]|uniref:YraN family protein n=1 Tax=Cryptosporangium arvum TaxID=80871 RepID=UPI0004B11329|nr:YraN family protein [Cryptosporangium arvum]
MSAKQAVGAYGERVAVRHLEQAGLVVLARNWRCAEGELDIVAREGDALVVCEVKTRRGERHGVPAEAVIAAKAARLRRLAAYWIRASGVHAPTVRFDVVSVRPQRSGPARVDHLRGAF